MSIEVRELSHVYGEGSPFRSVAIEHVSFRVNDGEKIAVIGHTGSGKSTLIQHLNGLLKPTSGQVLVNDQDIHAESANRRALRQQVGLVFQYPEYQLFEETIAKDIAFGPKNMGLSADEMDRRVRESMAAVHLDYDSLAERSPFDLSGGQMRRVAIAGVLAMRPSVLVLDEPAAGLDPKGRDSLLDMILSLREERGTTLIMVTHSMDDVARMADRVLVMNHGRLIHDTTPQQLFQQVEEMEAIGLGVPEAAKLAYLLRKKGLPIADTAITPEAVQQELIRLWKEGPAC